MDKTKVYIVDDHEMFREGVKTMLQNANNFEIIGEAKSGKQCLDEFPEESDVVLMDISMPEMNGIETTQKLVARYPQIKIIALSMFGDEEYYYKMVHSGVKGFVLKESGSDELKHAILEVYKGNNYFSQELLRNIIVSLGEKDSAPSNSNQPVSFTKKEIEIMHEICGGYSNKEIADRLNIGLRTVESYKSKLIKKTEVRNTIGLVMYAIKNKIISIG